MKKRLSEDEKRYKKLYSIENLKLAWDRINTSTNDLFFKNFYRQLFWYYEFDLDSNLACLSKKLQNNAYKPSKSLKVYKPKQSGLQRVFSLLDIEDLIVYQAIANIIIPVFANKRKSLENKTVFSNLFNKNLESNIFLYQEWQTCYKKYKKNISENFTKGLKYTAHFDLAAYYDTIDQNSLLSSLFNDIHDSKLGRLLSECLQIWCNKTDSEDKKISHGIPQGPLSSSIFGELFLLSIDEFLLKNNVCYSRYVDDIVIQSESLEKVQHAVILLDIKCKEKGLVPQTSKFSIFEAKSIEEAIGKNPSLSTSQKEILFSDENKVLEVFCKAFEESTFDSSIIRYILKVYNESDILIDKIKYEFSNHYEFTEEFCIYLGRFVYEKSSIIFDFINQKLSSGIPYDYVESELWVLLAKLHRYADISSFATLAISKLIKSKSDVLKYGIYTYLSKLDDNRFVSFLSHEENKLILLFKINDISKSVTENKKFLELVKFYANRNSNTIKTILSRHLYFMLQYNEITEKKYKQFINFLPPQNRQKFETINFYLKEEFGIDSTIDWKVFFGDNFDHANTIFYHAHLAGKRHKSEWLNAIDSFNDLLTRAFITNLERWDSSQKTPPLIVKDKKNNSKAQDIGCPLDKGTSLAKTYPLLIENAHDIHKRRCKNPLSHAIDEKTFQFTSFVTKMEYYEYYKKETIVLSEIVRISKKII